MARFYVINSIKEEWEKTKELPLVKPQIPPVRAQLPPPKDKNHKIWLIASVLFALLIIGGLFAYPLISDGPIAGQAIGDRREIQKIEPIPVWARCGVVRGLGSYGRDVKPNLQWPPHAQP